MKTRVSLKGQIVLPAELRRRDGIEAGQEFDVAVSISSSGERAPLNDGVVDRLLACPEKGFFVPIEFESTDTV